MYNLSDEISIIPLELTPHKEGFDRSILITENFTLGELYDATKVLDKQTLFAHGIPMHRNFPALFSLLRQKTGKPISIGSAYRSPEWEASKGRSGLGDHPKADGYDFSGLGINKLIDEAITTKNDLFHEMQELGVTAFGEYKWGWHLGFRTPRPDGKIYFWSDIKKKTMKSTKISQTKKR